MSIYYDCEADCAPECLVLPFGLLHVSLNACSLASCPLFAPWVRRTQVAEWLKTDKACASYIDNAVAFLQCVFQL